MTIAMAERGAEHPEAREKLPDEQMGRLMSAVGNHEVKAITIILMRDGNPHGRKDLYGKVLSVQGDDIGWAMNREVPFGYCSTFSQFGLVGKEEIDPRSSVAAYTITEDGKEEGIPLAGQLLNFSEKHNISLDRLFGGTRSSYPEKRSPSTTLKIIYGLVISTSFPIRKVDLAERIGEEESSHLHGHLVRLSELGLIEYQGKEINAPISRYKLSLSVPEGELPNPRGRKALTQLVFDVLKVNPDRKLTAGEILNLLPAKRRESESKRSLKNRISVILSFLSKKGYVELEKFNRYKQSEINITDTQRAILAEILEVLYRFQNRDKEILSEGRRLAEEIITNPQRISALLRRAREASRYADQSPSEETQKKILSCVSANLNGVTIRDIREFLKKTGKKMGSGQIGALSSLLVKSGSIRVKKEGNVLRFFTAS